MKRQLLKGLAALCAGVMTLCATSSLFVSCDKYDDTLLKQEISDLKGELDDIEERLEAVEALTAELEALTAKVEALYTLKFQVTDSNELQYSFDGGKTWKETGIKLVETADLKFKNEGNKLMYSTDGKTWVDSGVVLAENCDNEFTFKVENAKVYFSSDNGKTWKETGATVVDPCTCPKVELVDNGDSVTIKVGEASFTIEKPEEIVFELRAGKLYFASEGVQKVAIKSSGIEDVTVMAAPKGWWAEINADGMVEITAPNVEDTEPTGYDSNYNPIYGNAVATGYVKVHACSVEGKCMVGKLAVEVSEDQLVVKAYGGKYEVATTYQYEYYPAYFGVSKKDSYLADAKVLLDAFANQDYDTQDKWTNKTTSVAEGQIADILGYEPKVGEEYVVWAVQELGYDAPTANDLVLAFYSPVTVSAKEIEGTKGAYDTQISVEVLGAQSYWALAVPDMGEFGMSVEEQKYQMVDGIAYGSGFGKEYKEAYNGSFYRITEGTQAYVGEGTPGTTGTLLILPVDGRPADMYTTDDVYAFEFTTNPLLAGGSVDSSAEQIFEGMKYDQSVWDYTLQPLDEYTELGVKVTPSAAGWKYHYFAWFTPEQMKNDAGADLTDAELVAAVLGNQASYPCSPAEFEAENVWMGLTPDQTMHFVSFFVDENDKYGKLEKKELKTKALSKSEIMLDVEVSAAGGTWDDFEMAIKNTKTIEFTITPTEPVSQYRYVWSSTNNYKYYSYEGMNEEQVAEALYFAEEYDVELMTALPAGNKLVFGAEDDYDHSHEYGETYFFAILPYDMAGQPSKYAYVITYGCNYELAEVISDPESLKDVPTVNFIVPEKKQGEWGESYYWKDEWDNWTYSVDYTVKPVEGTEVRTLLINPEYGYNSEASAKSKASMLWAGKFGNQEIPSVVTEETTIHAMLTAWQQTAPIVSSILVSWKDKDGKYYFKEISIAEELKVMYEDLADDVVTE